MLIKLRRYKRTKIEYERRWKFVDVRNYGQELNIDDVEVHNYVIEEIHYEFYDNNEEHNEKMLFNNIMRKLIVTL